MAVTYPSGYNTNLLASAFNKMFSSDPVNLFATRLGLLGCIMSDEVIYSPQVDMARVISITGSQIELTVIGDQLSPAMLSTDAAQLTTRTRAYTELMGAQVFDAAFGICADDVPETVVRKVRGDVKKYGPGFLETRGEIAVRSIRETLATQLHNNTAPGQGNFGGLQFTVSNTGTYGGVNRATAGNEVFQSQVNSTAQTLEASTLEDMRVALLDKGEPNLIVTGETLYGKLQKDFNNSQMITWTEGMARYGSMMCIYAGIPVLLDKRTASSVLYMLDTKWFKFFYDANKEWSTGYNRDPLTNASWTATHSFFLQLLCSKGSAQGKFSALSA